MRTACTVDSRSWAQGPPCSLDRTLAPQVELPQALRFVHGRAPDIQIASVEKHETTSAQHFAVGHFSVPCRGHMHKDQVKLAPVSYASIEPAQIACNTSETSLPNKGALHSSITYSIALCGSLQPS